MFDRGAKHQHTTTGRVCLNGVHRGLHRGHHGRGQLTGGIVPGAYGQLGCVKAGEYHRLTDRRYQVPLLERPRQRPLVCHRVPHVAKATVGTFQGGGKPGQETSTVVGHQRLEDTGVRIGRGVVDLVDKDDVTSTQGGQPAGVGKCLE